MTTKQQKTIEELDTRVAELEYQNMVLRRRNEKLAKEVDMNRNPLNGDQTLTLWRQSQGHAFIDRVLSRDHHSVYKNR